MNDVDHIKPKGMIIEMKRKLFSVLSVFLLLTVLLSACVTNGGTSNAVSDTSGSVSSEASTPGDEVSVPEVNMNGQKIRFLVPGDQYLYYESFDIYAAELNNEIINDAVFNRNKKIEQQFNCEIIAEKLPDVQSVARERMDAQLDDFDVYMPYMHSVAPLAAQGYFHDLNSLEYLNLDQDYWDQKLGESLSIDGKLYFSTGDISMLDNECTMVMFFNKTLIKDNNLDDPYQLVKDHKWTLDKVYTMSKDFTKDNGDGVYDEKDTYGLHIAFNAPHSFFFSGGGRITSPNASGGFDLVMKNNKNVAYINHINEITNDPNILTNNTPNCNTFEAICKIFTEGRVIFTTFALVDMFQFRDSATLNFGILPYPLADEEQKEYSCLVSTGLVPVVCIPTINKNLDNTSIIVDALARESVNTVTKAYYETLLKKRTLQDNDSQDMLDIIFKSRAYDIGYVFNWGGIGDLIYTLYGTNKEFVSSYDAIEAKVILAMNETLEFFDSID